MTKESIYFFNLCSETWAKHPKIPLKNKKFTSHLEYIQNNIFKNLNDAHAKRCLINYLKYIQNYFRNHKIKSFLLCSKNE
jgi:hypothetical protein